MDPFTQRMLEKAEQRSRALGICNASVSRFPLGEPTSETSGTGNNSGVCATTMAVASQKQKKQQLPLHTSNASPTSPVQISSAGNLNKLKVIEKAPTEKNQARQLTDDNSPRMVLRQFSAVDKENMDLGIEINITTDKNIEVQVQVEEQDITDEDVATERFTTALVHTQSDEISNSAACNEAQHPNTAKIRDTSRNRLQRLGALYSNPADLSSPIHRTEGQFHADGNDHEIDNEVKKPKQRLGKLAALANTINQWEDDTSHHALTQSLNSTSEVVAPDIIPPPKPDLPSRGRLTTENLKKVPKQQQTQSSQQQQRKQELAGYDKTKQLKWDPTVLNSLEAQGFQRRDSSTVRVSYDFVHEKENNEEIESTTDVLKKPATKKVVKQLNPPKLPEGDKSDKKMEKKRPTIKPGLVSGRTAIFESQAQNQQQQKPQKDPTELSLKERMKFFEKNKGEALIPKAAFGMAPPISKILQDAHLRKEQEQCKAHNSNALIHNNVQPPLIKTLVGDSKVRDKVAALVNFSNENNKIKEDILKQRQEDMQLLANRFNKQKQIFEHQQHTSTQSLEKDKQIVPINQQSQVKATAASITSSGGNARTIIPPPPPPPPPSVSNVNNKRRSPGDTIDDDTKRHKFNSQQQQRLYPALSDLESNESYSDNEKNCCTTATISAISTSDEMRSQTQPLTGDASTQAVDQENDSEDSYMESEQEDSSAGICNGSLGRVVMQVVQKNDEHGQSNKVKEVRYAEKDHYFGENTVNSSITSSEASMGVDDYLDEALDEDVDDENISHDEDDDDNDNSRLSRNSKGTTASDSFSFRKISNANNYTNCERIEEEFVTPKSSHTMGTSTSDNAYMHPVKSELSVNKESENMVTLVHTVSFYRKQQSANSANSTPIRKICREQQVLRSAMEKLDTKTNSSTGSMRYDNQLCDPMEDADDTHSESEVEDTYLVQDKIKKLLDEVCKQQQVIAQTSQALNLCAATIEFSGSTESVEGERHLLVATHRRQACLDEVQRLRVEKSVRPLGAPREKGRLTVKEITIPLRQDYIRKLASDTISGHHLVCLLKYNEHVLATKTVPTLPGLLAVKFPDVLQLNNVYADFKVTLEIYGMTAQREVLPHEVKYHINLNKKSGIKTPKKKGGDNRLVMPPVQSPAGPHVVRTPALVQYGFAIFSLREIQRTSWTLTQVLGVSPLEGIVHMKVNCELSVSVEYKGFLTMFEDISGFGAWHRRWCHLNGTMLNYWKYPDDEKKKTPMGSIDLYTCTSQKVNTAPRDICARLNTMLLECQRPARDTDEESLIIVPNGRTTIVRYLLSADTKEEREEWCAYFNKALTLLRAWGPPQ